MLPSISHKPEPRSLKHISAASDASIVAPIKPEKIRLFYHWSFIPVLIWMFGFNVQEEFGWFALVWGFFFLFVVLLSIAAQATGEWVFARLTGRHPVAVYIYPLAVRFRYRDIAKVSRQNAGICAGMAGNVLFALALYPFLHLYLPYWDYRENIGGIGLSTLLFQLQFVNIFLVLINLIPAWPLKAGQWLENLLHRRISAGSTRSLLKAISVFTGSIILYLGFHESEPALIALGILCIVMTQFRLIPSHPWLFRYQNRRRRMQKNTADIPSGSPRTEPPPSKLPVKC